MPEAWVEVSVPIHKQGLRMASTSWLHDLMMTFMGTTQYIAPEVRRWQPRAVRVGVALLAALLGFSIVGCEPDAAAPTVIEALFRDQRSGVVVEGSGHVTTLLPDDIRGSRHQRFILRLDSGRTLLVSHNIDLAPRLEALSRGDRVAFRGRYEWNERGGVVHWTHRAKYGRGGGWLDHRGRTYR